MVFENILDAIGGTPIVKLQRMPEADSAEILVKVEALNVGGSIKTRTAYNMLREAAAQGILTKDSIICEPTSGNQGIGIALVGAVCGYRVEIVMPDSVSEERRKLIAQYGAKVILVHDDGDIGKCIAQCLEVAQRRAAEDPNVYIPQQFVNPHNPKAHRDGTGREILEQVGAPIHGFCSGIGTGGTISGTGHYLKDVSNGAVQVIGADPEGSIYSDPNDVHQYQIEGVGEDFYPKAFDRSLPDEIVQVTDAEAFEMTRRLANEEGLLVGGSSGMAVFSALKYAREHDLDENQLVVVLMPDSGRSYMEKIFNDDWMRANGFADVVERTTKPSLAEQYL